MHTVSKNGEGAFEPSTSITTNASPDIRHTSKESSAFIQLIQINSSASSPAKLKHKINDKEVYDTESDGSTCSKRSRGDTRSGLAGVFPYDIWVKMSYYCTPASTFNLCRSDRVFDSVTFFSREGREESLTDKLLSNSLESSMERVLRNKFREFVEEDDITTSFRRMCKTITSGSLVISGSSITQAILGVEWEGSDIDIYCTLESAPVVRSWLVDKANKTLVSVKTGHTYTEDKVNHGPFYVNEIMHVERYGDTPSGTHSMGHTGTENDTISYDTTTKTMLDFSYPDGRPIEIHGVGQTCIPFNRSVKETDIDLIIVESGTDVTDMINKNFDLGICKAVFDGVSFKVPDLHGTLQHQTTLCPVLRNELSKMYMESLHNECKRSYIDVVDALVSMYESENGLFDPWSSSRDINCCIEIIYDLYGFSFYLSSIYNSNCIFAEAFDQDADDSFLEEAFVSMFGTDTSDIRKLQCKLGDIKDLFCDLRKVLIRSALEKIAGNGLICKSTADWISDVVHINIFDTSADECHIFHIHNVFVIGVRRWMKYMARGIDIKWISSPRHLPSEQKWVFLSREMQDKNGDY